MSMQAPIRTGYSVRILIISLALTFGGLWFLYDGMIVYPHRQEIYHAYEQIRQDHPNDWRSRWEEKAAEENWSTSELPDQYTDGQILQQRVIAAGLLPLGVAVGVYYLRLRRRWIASDDQGLSASWGERVPWESIRSLDKSRWKRKGIAVVHYDAGGVQRRLKLDDWKYETEAIEQMVRQVESQISSGNGEQSRPEGGVTVPAQDEAARTASDSTGASQHVDNAEQ